MEREHTYLEFPQDVLGHVIFSDRVHHEALVANRAIRRPVLMAFFLKNSKYHSHVSLGEVIFIQTSNPAASLRGKVSEKPFLVQTKSTTA